MNLERERTVRPRVEEPRGPPPSNPKVDIPAWTPSTKPEDYFSNAERLFRSHKIPEDLWVSQLFSKLPDKARTVFSRLSEQEALYYPTLEAEILKDYLVSPKIHRQNFFTWVKKAQQTHKEFLRQLAEQLKLWVEGRELTHDQWVDKLLGYRLDIQLPEEIRLHLSDKKVEAALPGGRTCRRLYHKLEAANAPE